MAHRVTAADVAREAGVSLMTVSRVVNNKGDVSSATRARVQAVIERLGYRPSDIARGLVTKRTYTLGLVVPDNANPFFSEVARGAEDAASSQGYNVFLCNTMEDPERELSVLQSLEEKRVDGVMLCSSRLEEEQLVAALSRHPAVVLVNRRLEGGHEDIVRAVLVNDEAGGRMATEYLLGAGHRVIGFVAGPPTSYSGRRRAKGYLAALAAAGVTYRPEWTRHCLPMIEGGRGAAFQLLSSVPDMTALFCYNDLVAVGAIKACADLDRAVPDDVAIVGFDDIPLAALVTPALTTCRVPRYELGSRAMKLLLNQIDECTEGCQDVVLEPELVIRASAP